MLLQPHAVGMTHLTARCFNLGPLELKPLFGKTKPYVTCASQVDKLSLFLFVSPFGCTSFWFVVLDFYYACFVFFIAFPFLILFSPFFSLEAMSRPAAGTPLSPTGQTAAL